jgi:hypothetical protein
MSSSQRNLETRSVRGTAIQNGAVRWDDEWAILLDLARPAPLPHNPITVDQGVTELA